MLLLMFPAGIWCQALTVVLTSDLIFLLCKELIATFLRILGFYKVHERSLQDLKIPIPKIMIKLCEVQHLVLEN